MWRRLFYVDQSTTNAQHKHSPQKYGWWCATASARKGAVSWACRVAQRPLLNTQCQRLARAREIALPSRLHSPHPHLITAVRRALICLAYEPPLHRRDDDAIGPREIWDRQHSKPGHPRTGRRLGTFIKLSPTCRLLQVESAGSFIR